MEINNKVVQIMGSNPRRSRATLVPIKQLVQLIRSHLGIALSIVAMVIVNKVPNLRLVRPSYLYYILLAYFMVRCNVVSMMRGRISVLPMYRLVIYCGIVL